MFLFRYSNFCSRRQSRSISPPNAWQRGNPLPLWNPLSVSLSFVLVAPTTTTTNQSKNANSYQTYRSHSPNFTHSLSLTFVEKIVKHLYCFFLTFLFRGSSSFESCLRQRARFSIFVESFIDARLQRFFYNCLCWLQKAKNLIISKNFIVSVCETNQK